MRDIDIDPDADRPYECFRCGEVVVTAVSPGRCPSCGGAMRNCKTPIE